ncbi:GH32 C-terminal domain-containing protein [Arthrobacter sp. ISL-30]|uniref:GH32 C-terminal domain-containing protein n=1 Tax=Arthrobacter sp. ISL-30 TaxID=2819109 RepID=UPI001BE84046|nr:GH32 C-terminal domain-containing protein [Arthrobacter sp. ISL-30]MBT2512447.1 GH32 C-terminal domain-containing protein [Arthrobacter sp. ISL-30]
MKGDFRSMHRKRTGKLQAFSTLTLAGLTLAGTLAGAGPATAGESDVGSPAGGSSAASGSTLGQEPYRPAFHFSPEKNWMNDPNGMVYHKGVYHLYYQHNPSGNTWGNMSWGHATSTDLVHWKEQPLAISTDDQEDVFSGSVVVDKDNSSGFGTAENPPLVAIYTSAYKEASPYRGLQAQSLAYSLDDGQTWTKYDANPVLNRNSANFRDPKVFWYNSPSGGGYWVMTAVEALDHKVHLYKSSNLKDWTALSEFGPANATGGLWECPDLFPLAVDGDPNNVKWVMVVNINPGGVAGGSAGQYFVGSFDGTTFTSESTKPAEALPAGTVLAGFNDGTYNGWTVNNEPGNWKNGPFTDTPAAGTLPGQNIVGGFAGAGLINSFNDFDWPLGSMTSPQFTVGSDYINFLVGGGQHPRVSDKLDNTPPPGDLLFDGFEVPDGSSLADAGWTGTGDLAPSFQPATAGGDYYIGAKRINTFETGGAPGDERQGTLTSPAFTISRNFMSMLVGGGHRSPETGQVLEAQLLVDGNVVRSLAGDDAGQLNWKGWDVSEFVGGSAQLRIVDQATGGWGHLTLDHVILTDQAAVPRSDETTVNLVVDGQVVRSATGANSEVLDWASWNVAEFKGRQASIKVIDNNRFGWGHILADEFIASAQPASPRINTYDWLDYGRDYYASVSFGNMPEDKRVMLGWMNNWDYANSIPTSPWRSAMSLPREVGLTQTPDGPRLTQQAVKQVDGLAYAPSYQDGVGGTIVPGTHVLPSAASGQVQRIDVTFAPGTATKSGITVLGNGDSSTVIGYDAVTKELYVDRGNSGNTAFHPLFTSVDSAPVTVDAQGNVTLRIYVDRSSVEVFAQDGLRTITDQVFPEAGARQVALFADGGTAQLKSLTVTPLRQSMFLESLKALNAGGKSKSGK